MNEENKKPTYGIAVDAACSGNPGTLEYRGIDLTTGREIFHFGPMYGTNNIGECLALCWALQIYGGSMPIYSDSKTALAWVRDLKHKCTLQNSVENGAILTLLEQNLINVAEQNRKNILKWDTKNWGEIPADFGRKK